MTHYPVTLADVLEAHQRALTFGGREGVVSLDSILSAIGRPYSGYFESVPEKSAALLHALIQNHGFADGNKRTALLTTTLFIRRSGFLLNLDPAERIDDMVVAVASGDMTFDDVLEWFQERLVRS